MEFAIDKHRNAGELSHHKEWIKNLLVGYYDPMYDYQLSKKIDRVVFRGENESILEHLNNFYGISC